ncbi:MAG: hypothetical protein ACJAZN_000277 [Planctomycetota bacterium]|jgi:hypothetical protein
MRIHDSLILSLAAAFSACPSVQDPAPEASPPTSQPAVAPLGKVVEEIDPRIWEIYQARGGDYWFGSNGNGVYRYDGKKLIQYTEADGLSGHQVHDIQEDSKGNLFFATYGGVSLFDGQKFTTLELVETNPADDKWELNPDDVWIVFSPSDYGPCRFDGENLYHLKLSKSPVEDAYNAKYPTVAVDPADVYRIYKDRRGHIWIGTASAGLCRYDGKTLSWMFAERLTTTASGGSFGIRSIFEDRKGDFWITNTRQRFEVFPEPIQRDGYSLLEYKKKEGLPNAQSDTDKNFTYYPSITEDKAGVLWVASGSGSVLKYDGRVVTHYPLADDAYTCKIICDQRDNIWASTIEHGVYRFNGESFEPFKPGK